MIGPERSEVAGKQIFPMTEQTEADFFSADHCIMRPSNPRLPASKLRRLRPLQPEHRTLLLFVEAALDGNDHQDDPPPSPFSHQVPAPGNRVHGFEKLHIDVGNPSVIIETRDLALQLRGEHARDVCLNKHSPCIELNHEVRNIFSFCI